MNVDIYLLGKRVWVFGSHGKLGVAVRLGERRWRYRWLRN